MMRKYKIECNKCNKIYKIKYNQSESRCPKCNKKQINDIDMYYSEEDKQYYLGGGEWQKTKYDAKKSLLHSNMKWEDWFLKYGGMKGLLHRMAWIEKRNSHARDVKNIYDEIIKTHHVVCVNGFSYIYFDIGGIRIYAGKGNYYYPNPDTANNILLNGWRKAS